MRKFWAVGRRGELLRFEWDVFSYPFDYNAEGATALN
jgi:hypothetical protein